VPGKGWIDPPDEVYQGVSGRYMVDVYYVGGNDSLKQPGWKEQLSRVTLLADSEGDALMTAANMLIAQGFFVTRTDLIDWPEPGWDEKGNFTPRTSAKPGEVVKLTKPVRARILQDRPQWGGPGPRPADEPFIPAGTEGLVTAWSLGDTVPTWRPDGNIKVKTRDAFLVEFPMGNVVLMQDEVELLDPIPRRKAES
jgi:hypothetical protein